MASILIIDDDPDFGVWLDMVFGHEGHDVVVATNGEQGLLATTDKSFDLVITDIFMPEMDGIEVIQKLRGTENAVKIIAISSGGSMGDEETFLSIASSIGADQIVSKPFSSEDIVARAQALLG